MSLSSYYDDEEFVIGGDSEPIDGEVRKIKMSLRERPRQIQTRLSLRKQIEDLKCGGNQDNDNQRKSRRKHSTAPAVKWNPFEERINKYYREHEYCDCMDDKCPGCFYDCPNCGSPKCGPTCKVHRKFAYDSIEFDGKDGEIKNKHVAKN